jgi:sec-independent protein translocase protein TatA
VTFPSGWELILVLLVILVLFGAKRLPDSARSLGRSMRILKAETRGLRDEDDDLRDRPREDHRDGYRDTTVTAEPLPPVEPPRAPGGHGNLTGDQAQQPRP